MSVPATTSDIEGQSTDSGSTEAQLSPPAIGLDDILTNSDNDPYGMRVKYMRSSGTRADSEERKNKKRNRIEAPPVVDETEKLKSALRSVLGEDERSILHKFCAQLYLQSWFPIFKEAELHRFRAEQLEELRREYDSRFQLVESGVLSSAEEEAEKVERAFFNK